MHTESYIELFTKETETILNEAKLLRFQRLNDIKMEKEYQSLMTMISNCICSIWNDCFRTQPMFNEDKMLLEYEMEYAVSH